MTARSPTASRDPGDETAKVVRGGEATVAALRRAHAAKLDWLLRHLIARVALKKGGVLGGGKQLSLIPKYLSKAQLADPRSTRTSLDYPLWCAEQDVAAQEPDGDGAVEETEDM